MVQGNVGSDEDWEIGVSLETPEKVRKLQKALHAKAKGAPDYRFYLLYDKVYRADILEFAYRLSEAKGGSPGVDGQTFADIEAYGAQRWLGELAEAYRVVDTHTRQRLRQWLRAKHKTPGRGTSRFPDEYLYETVGLVRLELRTRNFPWAKA